MTPWVARLIATNVAMFALGFVVQDLMPMLAFRPRYLLLQPWTPLTYMFVHGGLLHLFFNMMMLYFAGPRVEDRLGSNRFIVLYLLSGLGGAALSFITPNVAIVGASGATFGVFLAYARFWPHEKILIWGIAPVEARVLVLIGTVFALWGVGSGIAHWAHLGGYAAAYLYMLLIDAHSDRQRFRKRVNAATYGAPSPVAPAKTPDFDSIKRDGLHTLTLEELDRLRAKVAAQGAGALTPDERAFLHRMQLR
jgi:membrane associated rhomboid family serine protease